MGLRLVEAELENKSSQSATTPAPVVAALIKERESFCNTILEGLLFKMARLGTEYPVPRCWRGLRRFLLRLETPGQKTLTFLA